MEGGRTISEFVTLFWVVIAGATVGLVFDFYRSLRSWQGWKRVSTFLGDILFSLVALFILFRFFARANALAFRFYIIWGSLLGLIIYLRLISPYAVSFFFKLFSFLSYLAGLTYKGIKIPFRGLGYLMQPPYAVLRWFGLLLYRIVEHILLEPLIRLINKWRALLKLLFPPRKED